MIKETVPECSPNYHLFKGLNDTRKNTLRGDLIKPCPAGEIGPQEPADLQGLPPWSTSRAHPETQKPAQRNRELQTELEPFLLDFLSALLSASLPSFPATELRKTLLTVHAPFAGKASHPNFSRFLLCGSFPFLNPRFAQHYALPRSASLAHPMIFQATDLSDIALLASYPRQCRGNQGKTKEQHRATHHTPAIGRSRTGADLGFHAIWVSSDLSASHPQAEPTATL